MLFTQRKLTLKRSKKKRQNHTMTKRKSPAVGRTEVVSKMLNSGRARKAAAKKAKKAKKAVDADPSLTAAFQTIERRPWPVPVEAEKAVDTSAHVDVLSPLLTETQTQDMTSSVETSSQTKKDPTTMNISLVRSNKARKSNAVTYTADGYNGSVRFSKSFFADKTGPESLSLDSEAFAAARQARAKMTAEERKAARAAAPKLTPAEKLAKIEERAAKLRAKIAAAGATA